MNGKQVDDFDIDDVGLTELQTNPVEKQSPWESRKTWGKVAKGISDGSIRVVAEEKGAIENAQRKMRAAEESTDIEWSRLFSQPSHDDDQEFTLLAKVIPDQTARTFNQEWTVGVWKFIRVGAAGALFSEGVSHRSLAPTGQVDDN
ncbi:hypothetical protein F5Y11DRAFT_351647 [Daldinia sp. FL1419]|nr:hypothetical protein F5Y11DRAFT_351647 [Daldinia sp. FL1419]